MVIVLKCYNFETVIWNRKKPFKNKNLGDKIERI
jgi:hypothetical protein